MMWNEPCPYCSSGVVTDGICDDCGVSVEVYEEDDEKTERAENEGLL